MKSTIATSNITSRTICAYNFQVVNIKWLIYLYKTILQIKTNTIFRYIDLLVKSEIYIIKVWDFYF